MQKPLLEVKCSCGQCLFSVSRDIQGMETVLRCPNCKKICFISCGDDKEVQDKLRRKTG